MLKQPVGWRMFHFKPHHHHHHHNETSGCRFRQQHGCFVWFQKICELQARWICPHYTAAFPPQELSPETGNFGGTAFPTTKLWSTFRSDMVFFSPRKALAQGQCCQKVQKLKGGGWVMTFPDLICMIHSWLNTFSIFKLQVWSCGINFIIIILYYSQSKTGCSLR